MDVSGLAERFWSYVDRAGDDECWLWSANLNSSGYGTFRVGPKVVKSHRVAFALANGGLLPPPGAHVLHHCDVPRCANPAHLFLGTNAENVADKVAKGRQAGGRGHGALGTRSGTAKLNADQVSKIRQRYAAGGVSQYALGREYGVSQSSISLIIVGKNWWHVTEPPRTL